MNCRQVIRIDEATGERREYGSLMEAIDELNRELMARGGVAKDYATIAGCISRAMRKGNESWGYKWEGIPSSAENKGV
jgi:hypothetical protein